MWGTPWVQVLSSVQGHELADVVMLLGTVGAGPQGEACQRDGLGVCGAMARTGAAALPATAPQGNGTWRREWEGCWLRLSTGGGCRVHALTTEVGQHAAGPPAGTIPHQPTGDVVLVPTRPVPGLGLVPIAEAKPDGLHTLVVGDDPLQGGCFLGLLHPGQVSAGIAGLALALQGEPYECQEMGGPSHLHTLATLPRPHPSSGVH